MFDLRPPGLEPRRSLCSCPFVFLSLVFLSLVFLSLVFLSLVFLSLECPIPESILP